MFQPQGVTRSQGPVVDAVVFEVAPSFSRDDRQNPCPPVRLATDNLSTGQYETSPLLAFIYDWA